MVIEKLSEIPSLIAKGERDFIISSGEHFAAAPIVIKNAEGINISGDLRSRVIGGKKLHGIKPVSGEAALRFGEAVRERVLCCDLAENGITETGSFASRGFGRAVTPSHSELFVNGRPLNLSQYPKAGKFLHIEDFATGEGDEGWGATNGKLSDGYYYRDERPKGWRPSKALRVHGYWAYDWANSYEGVDVLDAEKGFVKTLPPYGNYQFHKGQRFYFLNIMEEVTEAGDYYIDRDASTLYFIPFEGETPDEVIISLSDAPAFVFEDCVSCTITNLTIEAFRGDGIDIKGGKTVAVADCHIRNIGNHGVAINNCVGAVVRGCHIHDCGDCGISAAGGDRATLTSSEILIENNHIHHIAKWTRCYQTCANITGVGVTVRHNLMHDAPHTAVLYWGNDMTITDNEIYSVVLETGDAGAVYSGRDYTCRGNVVSRNYIHHLGGVGMGTMGIYNDDCLSGTVMNDNFFCECSRAIFMGGGRDFVAKNNVLVNCYPCVSVDGRGKSDHSMWRSMVNTTLRERFYNITGFKGQNDMDGKTTLVTGVTTPYIDRYPELADIDAFYHNGEEIPHIPASAVIRDNVFCSKREIELDWDSEGGDFDIGNNYSVRPEDFRDYAFGDFTLMPDSEPVRGGVHRGNIFACGLIEGDFRFAAAKIASKLERDGGEVVLTLHNKGAEASGEYILYCADGTEIPVSFHLCEDETASFRVKTAAEKISARSPLSGARPCVI